MSSSKKAMNHAKSVVEASLVKWKTLMGLGHWTITTIYHRDDGSMSKRRRKQRHDGWGALMWVQINWEYLDATVNVALHRLVDRSDDDLDMDVRHELAHIVVNEMREMAGLPFARAVKHEERVVTMLAYAFGQTHIAGWNEGRDALRTERAAAAGDGAAVT